MGTMEHHPDDLEMARTLIVLYGGNDREEAQRRADLATLAKSPDEVVRWTRVLDANAALEDGVVSREVTSAGHRAVRRDARGARLHAIDGGAMGPHDKEILVGTGRQAARSGN